MTRIGQAFLTGLLAFVVAPAATAQDAANNSPEETEQAEPTGANQDADYGAIVVTANRDGNYIVRGGDIKEMVEAFNKWRPEYAPNGLLYLQFRPAKDQQIDNVEGQLRRGNEVIDLTFDERGLAFMPVERLGDGKWELSFNQVKGKLRIFPTILSPGTDEQNRRIGDIRLQCRVFWGYYNNRVNIVFRGLFDLVGGCTTKRVGAYYPVEKEIETAIIDGRSEPQKLLEPDKKSYLVPLADNEIDNDAMLRITYAVADENIELSDYSTEEAATESLSEPTSDSPEN